MSKNKEFAENLSSQISFLNEILSFFVADSLNAANGLIARFKTFQSVLSASQEELLTVKGMNPEAARMLSSFHRLNKEYTDCMNCTNVRVFNSESACRILKPKFSNTDNEKIALLILNSRGQVMFNEIISEGSIHMVPVYIRNVMRLCLDYNADTVIFAHNHPGGNPIPTAGDIHATKELQLAMESIYVSFYDHIVFSDEDYFSMRSSGWLKSIVKTTDEFRRSVIKEKEGNENES